MRKSVALRYSGELPAPFIAAKGSGRAAERIDDLAVRSGVPVVPEAQAAEGLYPLDLGAFIPEVYFEIIARVLAAVRRIEEEKR
jgi:flagellar biosynthesis protein FlhB